VGVCVVWVCDRFDYVDELTTYLYQNSVSKVCVCVCCVGVCGCVTGLIMWMSSPRTCTRTVCQRCVCVCVVWVCVGV